MKTALTGIPALPLGFAPELYTITFKNGDALFLTDHDADLAYRAQIYVSGYTLERSAISQKIGVDVATCDVTLYQNADKTMAGLPFAAFVLNGGFDGAHIKIERARQNRVVWLFDGVVTDANPDREKTQLTLSDPKILLNTKMPRNSFNPYCGWTLFDGGCGLSKSAFAHETHTAAGSTQRVLQCGLTQPDNYFSLGTVLFTSGANTGVSRTISDYSAGQIILATGLPHNPEDGDAFTAYPGCDKTRTVCKNVFNNEPNIRIFPYIPVPQSAV